MNLNKPLINIISEGSENVKAINPYLPSPLMYLYASLVRVRDLEKYIIQ